MLMFLFSGIINMPEKRKIYKLARQGFKMNRLTTKAAQRFSQRDTKD